MILNQEVVGFIVFSFQYIEIVMILCIMTSIATPSTPWIGPYTACSIRNSTSTYYNIAQTAMDGILEGVYTLFRSVGSKSHEDVMHRLKEMGTL